MLEKNTEKLHEYTEKNIDQVDRTQVVNLTRVTDKFMASLLASMWANLTHYQIGLLVFMSFFSVEQDRRSGDNDWRERRQQ